MTSVKISNKDISNYIKKTAKALGMSNAGFVSTIIEQYKNSDKIEEIKSDNEKDYSFGMKRTYFVYNNPFDEGKDLSEKNKSKTELKYVSKINMSDEINIDINKIIFNKNTISPDYSIYKNIIMSALKNKLNNEIDYHNYKPKLGYGNPNDFVIPIFFINIKRISFVNAYINSKEHNNLKESKNKIINDILSKLSLIEQNFSGMDINYNNEFYKTKDKQKSIIDAFSSAKEKIDEIIKNNYIKLKVDYTGWFLPIYLNNDKNEGIKRYDFLTVKYNRYNKIKENEVYDKEKVLCLLKGQYGYLYCNVFKQAESVDYFLKKYNSLLENEPKENKSIFHFIYDMPNRKNDSSILQEIISILKQKESALNANSI